MASIAGPSTTSNDPNYLGMLFLTGQNERPFTAMLGGIGGAKPVNTVNYPLNSNYSLNTASQKTQSEDTAATSSGSTSYARVQAENTIQIMKEEIDSTYANQSDVSTLAGLPNWMGDNPVTDKEAQQVALHLEQMANDLEFSLIQGTYVKKTASNVNSKTRGMLEACTSNAIDGGAIALTSTIFDSLTKTMADNGANLGNGQCVVFVNSSQKIAITDAYKLAERSTNVGGVNVETIVTNFGNLGVVYTPQMPQDEILVADMSIVSLAVLPYKGQALVLEDLAKDGASDRQMLYLQAGLDYGLESKHGKITNLAV